MSWLKKILISIVVLALAFAGLFFYFLYTPAAVEPELLGEFKQHSLGIDAHTRKFSWYKPLTLSSGAALVFVLHASNGDGNGIRAALAYEFDLLAEQDGFIVVYPDGYQKYWNDCRRSANYSANKENIDDVAFFKAMIDFFEEHEGVDSRKIFVTGLSNGGHMAYKLALEVPKLFAAFAPIAANLPVDDNLDCKKTGQSVSIAVFNGTDDPINPYDGGLVEILGNTSRGIVLSTMDTVNYWRQLAGIHTKSSSHVFPESDGLPHTSVIEQRWQSDDGVQVRLFTLKGSGHVVPSRIIRPPRILGERAADISGSEEIVKFFLGINAGKGRIN